MSRSHQHDADCAGDRCGYRKLYEGSQVSLADMASRQAQALSRVGRLRAGIVTALRRNYPQYSEQAEAAISGRLSDVDDEILLAYLEAFTGAATASAPASTLLALRDALAANGVTVTGDDPLAWVEQLHRRASGAPTPAPPAPTAPASPWAGPQQRVAAVPPAPAADMFDDDFPWADEEPPAEYDEYIAPVDSDTGTPAQVPAAAEEQPAETAPPAPSLDSLFSDVTPAAAADQPSDHPALPRLFPAETPQQPAEEPATQPQAGTPAVMPVLTTTPSEEEAPARVPAKTSAESAADTDAVERADRRTAEPSEPDASQPEPAAGRGKRGSNAAQSRDAGRSARNDRSGTATPSDRSAAPAATATAADESGPASQQTTSAAQQPKPDAAASPAKATPPAPPALGDLFDLWEGPLGATAETDGRWSPSPVKAKKTPQERPAAPAAVPPAPARTQPKPANTDDRASTPAASAAAGQAAPTDQPAAPDAAEKTDPRPQTPDADPADAQIARPSQGVQQPLRPQLIPTTPPPGRSRRRNGRTLRTQAEAPDDYMFDVPVSDEDGDVTLDDAMRQALLAAASIPRPVFTRDLVSVAGSLDVVHAWEAECRADPASYPVRFVAPKTRHRARGSLVFVQNKTAASASADSWWGTCAGTYRGARLYETGVLLHRVGDEIVSYKFSEYTALLRLSTPRGLVGVVVALDTRLAVGEPARDALRVTLGELVAERLTLIACLTTSAEPGSLEGLLAVVGELAKEEGWNPSAPVVCARSWEYADDRGSTAVLALGG